MFLLAYFSTTMQAKLNMICKKIQWYYNAVNTIFHPLFQLSARSGLYRRLSSLPMLVQHLMPLGSGCTWDFPSFLYTESTIHVRSWTFVPKCDFFFIYLFFFYVSHLSSWMFGLPNIVTSFNLKFEPVRIPLALCRNKIRVSHAQQILNIFWDKT